MEKYNYRNVLVSGNEYECCYDKSGQVRLFYFDQGIKEMFTFDDSLHDRCLSRMSYFVTPCQMRLEVTSIDFVNFETGFMCFIGRIIFED